MDLEGSQLLDFFLGTLEVWPSSRLKPPSWLVAPLHHRHPMPSNRSKEPRTAWIQIRNKHLDWYRTRSTPSYSRVVSCWGANRTGSDCLAQQLIRYILCDDISHICGLGSFINCTMPKTWACMCVCVCMCLCGRENVHVYLYINILRTDYRPTILGKWVRRHRASLI